MTTQSFFLPARAATRSMQPGSLRRRCRSTTGIGGSYEILFNCCRCCLRRRTCRVHHPGRADRAGAAPCSRRGDTGAWRHSRLHPAGAGDDDDEGVHRHLGRLRDCRGSPMGAETIRRIARSSAAPRRPGRAYPGRSPDADGSGVPRDSARSARRPCRSCSRQGSCWFPLRTSQAPPRNSRHPRRST